MKLMGIFIGLGVFLVSGYFLISDTEKFLYLSNTKSRLPSSYNINLLQGNVTPSDLSFIELKEILKENNIDTIDKLLAYLYDAKPRYMSKYSLAHRSFSLHGSSKEHPRAIIYGDSARFIITFNGHSDQAAYDKLEVVEFNMKTKKFEFREIQFNDLNKLKAGASYKISEIDGPNKKCLLCHKNSRPIWEPYPVWPGFYGADDDGPIGFSARGPSLKVPMNDQVKNDWKIFSDSYSKMGRYQYLREMKESSILNIGPRARPNSDLTMLLYRLNFYRIGEIMKNRIRRSFGYAYLYADRCYSRILRNNKMVDNKLYKSYQLKKIPVASAIERLVKLYTPKYIKAGLKHQVHKSARLMDDLYIDDNTLKSIWTDYYTFSNREVPFSPSMKRLDVLEAILLKQGSYTMAHIPTSTLVIIAAITEKFFPLAKVETWPSSLSEGVYQFDTGIALEKEWMSLAILDNFFSGQERKKIVAEESKDWQKFCFELESKFPKILTN